MVSPLRAKRILKGLTLYDVWQTCGIEPSRLSLIERGYKNLRPDEVPKLAQALKCEPQELFQGQELAECGT